LREFNELYETRVLKMRHMRNGGGIDFKGLRSGTGRDQRGGHVDIDMTEKSLENAFAVVDDKRKVKRG
jgi:hypothetical protein